LNNKCEILNSNIDDNWTIRNNNKKIILYSNDLKSMNKSFSIKLNKHSKINKVIISDSKGSLIQSRVYRK
jgi:hypothetical protein